MVLSIDLQGTLGLTRLMGTLLTGFQVKLDATSLLRTLETGL